MKRILIVVLGLMFALQMTAFAELRKEASDDSTTIGSYYYLEGENDKTIFNTSLYVWRIFGKEDQYFILWTSTNNEDNKRIVYSKKNPPNLEVVKNGKSSIVIVNKVDTISSDSITFRLKKDALIETYAADKVYVVYPTKDNSTIKYEIPKTIVMEWQTVLTTDMKKLHKELMN